MTLSIQDLRDITDALELLSASKFTLGERNQKRLRDLAAKCRMEIRRERFHEAVANTPTDVAYDSR